MNIRVKTTTVLLSICVAGAAATGAIASQDRAKALSEKASMAFAESGFDTVCPLIRENNGGEWKAGSSHIWILDTNNTIVCDGANVELEGLSLNGVQDPNGKDLGATIAGLPEGGAWAEWQWQNPATGEVGTQRNYVIKTGDYIFGAGTFD